MVIVAQPNQNGQLELNSGAYTVVPDDVPLIDDVEEINRQEKPGLCSCCARKYKTRIFL